MEKRPIRTEQDYEKVAYDSLMVYFCIKNKINSSKFIALTSIIEVIVIALTRTVSKFAKSLGNELEYKNPAT
jgi:hypothetical protein